MVKKIISEVLAFLLEFAIVLWIVGIVFGLLGCTGTGAIIAVVVISLLVAVISAFLKIKFSKTSWGGGYFFHSDEISHSNKVAAVVKYVIGVVLDIALLTIMFL